MAALKNHGTELARFLSIKARGVLSVRSDGVTLVRRVGENWKVFARKKADISIEDWRTRKLSFLLGITPWKKQVKSLPSMATIERWLNDGVCETPTGHRVEPDGFGPDGVPSWLLILGFV